jgi:hypothetical protein
MCQGSAGTFRALAALQTPNPTELETQASHQNLQYVSVNLYYRFIFHLKYAFILRADSCSRSSVLNVLQISPFHSAAWTVGLMF